VDIIKHSELFLAVNKILDSFSYQTAAKEGHLHYGNISLVKPIGFARELTSESVEVMTHMEDNDWCKIEVKGYDRIYISELAFVNNGLQHTNQEEVSDPTVVKINSYNWTYVLLKSSSQTVDNYIINKDHYTYVVTFTTYRDTGFCSKNKDKVINSLTVGKMNEISH